jgi:hypothetical protein
MISRYDRERKRLSRMAKQSERDRKRFKERIAKLVSDNSGPVSRLPKS